MLTVFYCLANDLVDLNTILGVRKLAVADWRVLSRGEGGISQRSQAICQLRVQRGPLSHFVLGGELPHSRGELAAHLRPYGILVSVEVMCFSRILGSVKKFWFRSIDEMVIPCAQASQFAPIEMNPRQVCFGVQRTRLRLGAAQHHARQVFALYLGWNRSADNSQQRRHQVHKADVFLHEPIAEFDANGGFDNQRYVEGRIVDEEAMGLLPVFTQSFAVVTAEGYDRAAISSALL